MKIRQVRDLETVPVSLRSACDISRACSPMWLSPISPSSSALGTSAATESTTSTSMASERDQRFRDFERLLAVVRLRNQQIVHIHAQLLRVGGIERMLGIDERRHAAGLLRLGNHLQSDGGLAGRLRPEDFHHASARKSAHAQRRVERNRSGRDHRDRNDRFLRPQPHDRTFAKLLFNLRNANSIALPRSSAMGVWLL